MEIEISKLRENTGSVTQKLREMPIGEENAEEVNMMDAANIRGLITQIHRSNQGYKFTTCKTSTGIKVWRLA